MAYLLVRLVQKLLIDLPPKILFNSLICRLEAEVRAGCIEDDAELAEQVRQQSEALDATKKVTMNTSNFGFDI